MIDPNWILEGLEHSGQIQAGELPSEDKQPQPTTDAFVKSRWYKRQPIIKVRERDPWEKGPNSDLKDKKPKDGGRAFVEIK